MSAKHTPGPWYLRHLHPANVGLPMVPGPLVATPRGEIEIKQCAGVPMGERMANAALMAAAPELLAALERLTRDEPREENPEEPTCCFYCGGREYYVKGSGFPPETALAHRDDCVYLKARAALALAKGE